MACARPHPVDRPLVPQPMKSTCWLFPIVALALGANEMIEIPEPPQTGSESYWRLPGDLPANPDAEVRSGVPVGLIESFDWHDSRVYPGTTRQVWIYTPAQYDPARPAAAMIWQDGKSHLRETGPLHTPRTMDNLIADGLMPVTIGIFVDPGQRPRRADEGRAPPNPNLPLNRRIEYDTPNGIYAEFLATEIIPEVRRRRNLSTDRSDWAIGGGSSGGMAAFTAAWHRPDLFAKVLVSNGSFVNLLGGHAVLDWIREEEPKALRVALSSGPFDLANQYGVWWDANRAVARELAAKHYDLQTRWGDGIHNPDFGAARLGEVLRWIWRDHPEVLAKSPPPRARDRPVFVEIPAPKRPGSYTQTPDPYERLPDHYPRHPDIERRDDVPRGRVELFRWDQSLVYPGTTRELWVYVPAQYDPAEPAAIMIFQDGHQWMGEKSRYQVPTVCDNLIAAGDLPPMIAVFIEPGDTLDKPSLLPALISPRTVPPSNREVEYDSVDDRYVRFLLEEVLPLVEERWRVSADPADRALVGIGSGGSAAFNAAWHRPDQFGKVVSHVGRFIAMRGAPDYPRRVRESAPRPLRVFLQSGVNDQIGGETSGWEANLDLARELEAQRYDFKSVWGDGAHSPHHSAAVFPDTLRWLWRDHPAVRP